MNIPYVNIVNSHPFICKIVFWTSCDEKTGCNMYRVS